MPADKTLTLQADYRDWLASIKRRIHAAQMRVALAANGELIRLYYELGVQMTEREASAQWGTGFIDAFSKDLKASFPDVGGFSAKNLRYCRAFFRFYCDPAIWQQAVAKLAFEPWVGIDAELALRDMNKPMGVSEYTLVESLPDNLKGALPTVGEIEQDLQQLQAKETQEGLQ